MESPRYFSRFALTGTSAGGHLPHWSQPCATFTTFRLADSLPVERLEQFKAERDQWLEGHPEPWDSATREEYKTLFPSRFQKWLDAGHGSCVLAQSEIRRLVEDTLRSCDGTRYSLYAYVVMPNHVHTLFMPYQGFDGRSIVRGWKGYAARCVNKALDRTGALWQKESYDHLVRDVDTFNRIRSYIVMNNPRLAYDCYASGAARMPPQQGCASE